ncbi:ATP-binding protein [Parapedobacter sp.]
MQGLIRTAFILLILFCFLNNSALGQIKQITQELHILSLAPDSVSKVNSLNRLGTLYRSRNADSCFYYGMQAKRLATHLGYGKGKIDADHLIAFALFKKGLYAESLELLSNVLSQYQKLDDTEKIVQVYLDMAEVGNKGILDRTEITSLLRKAIKTGTALEKDSIMAEVYLSYLNRGPKLSEDSIAYYINKCTEIAVRYDNESVLAHVRLWQADLLFSNGQKEKAWSLVQQSLADAQRTGNTILEIGCLMTFYNYEDDVHKKLDYLYQQYETAQKSGDKYLEIYLLNLALSVGNALRDKDEIIKAYEELKKAMEADWENSRQFISDYVQFNGIQADNKLLSAENSRRTLWLVVISFAALIIILAIYLTMLRRNRKAKEQVEALNHAANMQIIAMEEAKHLAVKEEQQRLGQDLHDGLSSSLAGINHQLEVLSMDTGDASMKHRLDQLKSEITRAYETARSKSHEWFGAAREQGEQSFEQRIKLLTDSALPDSRYRKEIHIDDTSLSHVNADTRIALLRIIQEAITNIIKHAKATMVEILVYEEMERLFMIVKDDGKGLARHMRLNQPSAMGLQSIQRRAQLLNGELDIRSDEGGTEIIVTIPVKR